MRVQIGFSSISLAYDDGTLGPREPSPDLLLSLGAAARPVSRLLGFLIVLGLSVFAHALTPSTVTRSTLVPVKGLHVGLLFLVGANHGVVGAVRLFVLVLLGCFRSVDCRLEHVICDR